MPIIPEHKRYNRRKGANRVHMTLVALQHPSRTKERIPTNHEVPSDSDKTFDSSDSEHDVGITIKLPPKKE